MSFQSDRFWKSQPMIFKIITIQNTVRHIQYHVSYSIGDTCNYQILLNLGENLNILVNYHYQPLSISTLARWQIIFLLALSLKENGKISRHSTHLPHCGVVEHLTCNRTLWSYELPNLLTELTLRLDSIIYLYLYDFSWRF